MLRPGQSQVRTISPDSPGRWPGSIDVKPAPGGFDSQDSRQQMKDNQTFAGNINLVIILHLNFNFLIIFLNPEVPFLSCHYSLNNLKSWSKFLSVLLPLNYLALPCSESYKSNCQIFIHRMANIFCLGKQQLLPFPIIDMKISVKCEVSSIIRDFLQKNRI